MTSDKPTDRPEQRRAAPEQASLLHDPSAPWAEGDPNGPAPGDRWVFGYGSLMWRPGFSAAEQCPAVLYGYHRDMCVLSICYRGTEDRPGLVLGLRRAGSCRGIAFRVHADAWPAVKAYLHEREMVTNVYRPRFGALRLADGRRVSGYIFVADPDHPQYAGALGPTERVALIRQGQGTSGSARDYLANTVSHLETMTIRDRHLQHLLDWVDGRQPLPDSSHPNPSETFTRA